MDAGTNTAALQNAKESSSLVIIGLIIWRKLTMELRMILSTVKEMTVISVLKVSNHPPTLLWPTLLGPTLLGPTLLGQTLYLYILNLFTGKGYNGDKPTHLCVRCGNGKRSDGFSKFKEGNRVCKVCKNGELKSNNGHTVTNPLTSKNLKQLPS
jgi:hypothetical protein